MDTPPSHKHVMDDDDDDDDDDDLFLRNGWPVKRFKPYFQPGPMSDDLIKIL